MPFTPHRTAAPWLIGAALVAVAVLVGVAAVILGAPRVDPEAARGQLRSLVAAERAAAGALPVSHNAALDEIAQRRAEALATGGVLAHDETLPQHLPAGWWSFAENIADGLSATPEAMHRSWTTSPQQARNLLGAGYTDAGFGFAVAPDGTAYGVELFATYAHPPTAATIVDSAPAAVLTAVGARPAASSPSPSEVSNETYVVLFGAVGALALGAASAVLFVLFARRRAPRRRPPGEGDDNLTT